MRIMRFFIGDEMGNINYCDAIEYKSSLWLVPSWNELPLEGYKTPHRIIRADHLDRQDMVFQGCDGVLSGTVPKDVLAGQKVNEWEVVESPDIRFSIPAGIH